MRGNQYTSPGKLCTTPCINAMKLRREDERNTLQPPLGFVGRLVDFLEGLDRIEDRLHCGGGELLIEHPIHVKVANLRSAVDHIVRLALRGNQPASVEPDLSLLPDDPNLHREPKEPSHTLEG